MMPAIAVCESPSLPMPSEVATGVRFGGGTAGEGTVDTAGGEVELRTAPPGDGLGDAL